MTEQELDDLRERVYRALSYAKSGSEDGAHHKMWTIDQMVRALTGCPLVELRAMDYKGDPYTYTAQGKSDEYRQWMAAFCAGEDGPETYSWDEGIAP